MNQLPLPYSEIRRQLNAGEQTCVGLIQNHLAQIDAHNNKLNAFLAVYRDEALARAEVIDQKIAAGQAGSLAGLVVGIKDLLCY